MKSFKELDDVVFERFVEPTAWRVEHLFGITHARIARVFRVLTMLALIPACLTRGEPLKAAGIVVLAAIVDIILGPVLERIQSMKGQINPFRPVWQGRLIALCFALSVMAYLALIGMTLLELSPVAVSWLCYMACEYFGACNPMPPSFKKEQEAKDAERAMQTSGI